MYYWQLEFDQSLTGAAVSNIYSPPGADVSNIAVDDATYEPKLFSLTGRIGRLRMLAFSFGALVLFMVVGGILIGIGAALMGVVGAIILAVIVIVPLVVLSIAISVRRLNDLNHSGWWVLLSFVPFVSMLYGLYVLFAPGSKGSNDFGAAPSPNPTWVTVCALLLPVLFVGGSFVAMSSTAYQSFLDRAASSGSERSL
jgi:uncharacterized membrane protein YhaH (DUF805 family)